MSFKLIIESWLWGIIHSEKAPEALDESQRWLIESGLYPPFRTLNCHMRYARVGEGASIPQVLSKNTLLLSSGVVQKQTRL